MKFSSSDGEPKPTEKPILLLLRLMSLSAKVLTEVECSEGVCLAVMGRNRTDVGVFHGGVARYSASIALGSEAITSDIARALSVSQVQAEEIRIAHGSAMPVFVPRTETFPLGATSVSKRELSVIIATRLEDLFTRIQSEIDRSGFADVLTHGVMLCGEVTTIPDIVDLGEQKFLSIVSLSRLDFEAVE